MPKDFIDKQTKKRRIDKIIIHCSATNEFQNFTAKDIRRWHIQRGWIDIGYHFVICRDGTLETGRDTDEDGDIFEEIGAHTYGYNRHSLGICLIGGVRSIDWKPEANFTPKQWKQLELLLRYLKSEFPNATIHGHNEFAAKDCPSFDVQNWVKSVNL